jgi:Tfp pilus assembly protein FimT
MDKRYRTSSGFTLTELLMVMSLTIVMSAGAMALFGRAVPSMRANGQVNRILSLMQNGRESAIARQRLHIVRFNEGQNTINLIRLEQGVEVPVETVIPEYGVRITLFPDSPDTPDGYGAAGAVDFPEEGAFDSEGSFVDGAGLPMNGTLYIGMPGSPSTARAITITGSTGRARFYIWNGGEDVWEGGWLAK